MEQGRRKHRTSAGADMAEYARIMARDNSAELSMLRRNLIRALGEEVTPRQRQTLQMYYHEGLSMPEIGRRLGVNKSTVSRTIRRGEDRLRRCLRYGAGRLLREE